MQSSVYSVCMSVVRLVICKCFAPVESVFSSINSDFQRPKGVVVISILTESVDILLLQ